MTTRRQVLQAGAGLFVALPAWPAAFMATPAIDARQLDSWLAIHPDNTATLRLGVADLGQGATHALQMVAAEELDFALDQIHVAPLDTAHSPPQFGTYSSSAVQRGRPQVAAAAAEARRALLTLAATHLRSPLEQLVVERGMVRVRGAASDLSVSYGELIGERRFDLSITGSAPLKTADQYRLLGKAQPRQDLRQKVDGTQRYLQQQRLPGMLHARLVRPAGQAALAEGATPLHIDDRALRRLGDARLLRIGDLLAVVASREWHAVRGARELRVEWAPVTGLPDTEALHQHVLRDANQEQVALERGNAGIAFGLSAVQATQRCLGPYQAHAPFAPNAALADVRPDTAYVECASQDVQALRRSLAQLLKLPTSAVRVVFVEGAGTYGKSAYDDVAIAAALLSREVQRPVRVILSRADELGWDTYGPVHVGEVRAAADAHGRLTAYEYHGWQHNWTLNETSAQLAGLQPAAEWPAGAVQGVSTLDCGGMYAIPHRRLVNHRLDGLKYFKAGWLRSPLDLSFSFASEQAIDQLAVALQLDPVEFRRRNVVDERWRGVLDAVAEAAGWQSRIAGTPPPGEQPDGDWRRGRGVGLGTHLVSHGAAVADLSVNVRTGEVRIEHLYGALDAGAVVNPSTVEAQIMGQLVQTASRLLHEEVGIAHGRSTALDWQSYPVLRMQECPRITPVVVQRMDQRSTGAGEETMAAAAAAIANAFFDATGRRLNRYPLTAARVRAALA